MTKIPYLLFDIGNVFLYANHKITHEHLVDKHAVRLEDARKFFTIPEYSYFSIGRISESGFAKAISEVLDKPKLGVDEIRHAHDIHIKHLIEEAVDVLDYLSNNNFDLGFLTSTNEWQNEREKELTDFSKYSDVILRTNEIGIAKNDAKLYKYVLKKLSIDDVLFIDDNLNYIKTARSIGIKTLHVKKNVPKLRQNLKKVGVNIK